jgi:hypothetical protein
MSLGKLLATGRSLVGGAPEEGRYNISSRNRLPKFGSAKNPFAPSATSEARPVDASVQVAPQVELPLAAAQPSAETVNERVEAMVRETKNVCQPQPAASAQTVRHEETQRIPELADQPFGMSCQVGKLPVKGESFVSHMVVALSSGAVAAMGWAKVIFQKVRVVKWGALVSGVWVQIRRAGPLSRVAWGKVKVVFAKLAALIRKSEPKQVFPRLGKPAVQAELSLDTVKVVRNSLEDSDLEIVTAPTATSTVVAPTTPVASPKRGPVPPALKKMTERLLGVPTAD